MKFQEKGGFIKSVSRRRSITGKKSNINLAASMAQMDFYRAGGIIFILFAFFYVSNTVFSPLPQGLDKRDTPGSHLRGDDSCRTVWCMSTKEEFHFAIVADLDRQSKVGSSEWKSYFKKGILSKSVQNTWDIAWDDDIELRSKLGEDGRGLELSELATWENKLWTFDDRSGVVFEVSKKHQCIPRYILMEGDGENSKGQKTEWATVKDGLLYVGSFGKPYTNKKGEITSRNNLWVSIIKPNGMVVHEDWSEIYAKFQETTNTEAPGYMIHEAITWDEVNRLWYVLPRRVSPEPYDEKEDERKGSNLLLAFSEDFSKVVRKIEIGDKVDTHGWSSFKFVPWTKNEVIIGLRTMEIEDKDSGEGSQDTFITVFNVNGEVYLREQKIPGSRKYEGIEFL